MTLEGDDNYEETPSSALDPGVEGMDSGLQEDTDEVEEGESSGQPATESNWRKWLRRLAPLLGYLPTGTREEDTKRDGLLSYSVEGHASILGLAIGITAATSGDAQLAMMFVDTALGVGRVQQQFSETVESNLIKEPWYAFAGAAIGYSAVHYDLLAQLPLGLGV